MEKKLLIVEGLKLLLDNELKTKQEALALLTEGIINAREENSHSEDSSKMVKLSNAQAHGKNSITKTDGRKKIVEKLSATPQKEIVVGALVTVLFNKKERKQFFIIPRELQSITGKKIKIGEEEIVTIGTNAPLFEAIRLKNVGEKIPFLTNEIEIISIE